MTEMTENPWTEIFNLTAPETEIAPDQSDDVDNVHGAASRLSTRASFLIGSALSADATAPNLNRPYLIKGWLDRGTLSVVYGPPNAGKSFLALDIAHHIAIGAPWADCKVNKSAVLYIASEGGQSFQNRVAALEDEKASSLIVLPCSVDLGARSVSVAIRPETSPNSFKSAVQIFASNLSSPCSIRCKARWVNRWDTVSPHSASSNGKVPDVNQSAGSELQIPRHISAASSLR